nr:zinc finger, CCHC-type [Tanacetum cinerariifolium]
MGDVNPIRTLGYYSKPSHEDYRNTIELPEGSITTWEDLTTRSLAQFFPPRRTAKLHNDILMFNNIKESLFLKHELVSRTYSKSPSSWHRSLAPSPNLL